MEFIDLKKQYRKIAGRLEQRILSIMASGNYILGPEVAELEDALAEFTGVSNVVGVSSGTDALMASLMAIGVGRGDEVVTTPFSFIAAAEAVALVGATPVFVDIDPDTYNIDPEKIESAITERTKAIIPVSIFGLCPDMDAINAIGAKRGIDVIEDGAQSFGATYKGRNSCSISTSAITSFYPAKPLGCLGDGGAFFTDDDELALKVRKLTTHGEMGRYNHAMIGFNGRLDTLQAGALIEKLAIFPEEVLERQRIGARYTQRLGDVVKTPVVPDGQTHIYAQYTIGIENRDDFSARLRKMDIPTAIHYPVPIHLQPAFDYLGYKPGNFPNSENACNKVLSLPMSPYLAEKDQDTVIRAVREFARP